MAVASFFAALAVTLGGAAFGFAFSISRKVTALETQMTVIWPQVKFVTAMGLHSPTDHLGIDDLLLRYIKGTIEKDELVELVARVQKLESRTDSEEERLKAQGLLRMIRFEYQI
jgi:hypothetical protein